MSTSTARFSTRLAEKRKTESLTSGTPSSLAPPTTPPKKKQKLSTPSIPESSTKAPANRLRALTQGTGSQMIWKKVYENLGDSAPPIDLPGLNLMFLTGALYGKCCQVCTKRKGQVTLYASFIRLCWDCTVTNLVGYQGIEKDISSLCINTYLGRPSVKLRHSCYFFKDELEFHRRKIEETKLRPENETHQAMWSATMRHRKEYVIKLNQWSLRERKRTNQARHAILTQRQQDITSRIKAAGYEVEAAFIRIARLPGVNIRAELTDTGWDKIKGRILSALEYMRQQKIERDIRACFSTRVYYFRQIVDAAFKDVPKPPIPVPFYEILHAGPFHDILTSYTGADMRPLTDKMRQQLHIPDLAERIIEITSTWKKAADRHLVDLANSGLSVKAKGVDQPADTAPLELATTFFTCHWCPEALSYPRVLVHSCFRDYRTPATSKSSLADPHNDGDEEEEEDEEDASNHEEEPEENYGIVKTTPLSVWDNLHIDNGGRWNEGGDKIALDTEASAAAKSILLSIGEDPTTMTAARIQAMDIRVECMRCSASNSSRRRRPRPFMAWNMAIVHDMQDHFEQPRSAQDWRLVVDKDELAQIKGHEETKRRSSTKQYQCSFCHTTLSESRISQHYTSCHTSHPFDSTKQLEYVFETIDTPMKSRPPVHL